MDMAIPISITMAAKLQNRLEDVVRSLAVLKNIILWILGIALALVSGLSAMGAIAKDKAPELVVTLRPLNGFASEKLAFSSVEAWVTSHQGQFPNNVSPYALNLAKQAFVAEPITPEAVAVLALGSAEDTKRKLMNEAFALSRRQQLITGWMIADSGARNDVSLILTYFDTIIRTKPTAADVIIPVMVNALTSPGSIEEFEKILSQKPPWSGLFWNEVVSRPNALVDGAKLRLRLYSVGEDNSHYRDRALINSLIEKGEFDKAEELYATLSGKAINQDILRQSEFKALSNYPPLDWQLFSKGEYGASIDGNSLTLSAASNAGGLFARQLVELPADTLELTVKFLLPPPDDADVNLRLSCAENLTNPPASLKIDLKEMVTVKKISNRLSRCKFFWVAVWGRSSETGDGFDASVDSISLEIIESQK